MMAFHSIFKDITCKTNYLIVRCVRGGGQAVAIFKGLHRLIVSLQITKFPYKSIGAVLVFLSTTLSVFAQGGLGGMYDVRTNCRTVDCDSLFLIIEPEFTNVSQGCATEYPFCEGGDQFKQIFYKVGLEFSNISKDSFFVLAYRELSVRLRLNVTSSSSIKYSHINIARTRACYASGPGSNWGDTTGGNFNVGIFKTYPDSVDINFYNSYSGDPCGADTIPFLPDTCAKSGSNPSFCSFAHLFTVVVNAYPGEQIDLVCKPDCFYDDGTPTRCELSCVTTKKESEITVASPNGPTGGGANSKIKVRLKAPVTAANGKDGCDMGLEVINQDTNVIRVTHMDFVVKVSSSLALQPLEFARASQIATIKKVGDDWYLHFLVDTIIALNGGATSTFNAITVNPPVSMTNQDWSATLSFQNASATWLQTFRNFVQDCTTLRVDPDSIKTCERTNTPACSPSPAYKLVIEKPVPDNCSLKVRVGIKTTDTTLTSITLTRLAFQLAFATSDSMIIQSVNVGSFCPGGATSPCTPVGAVSSCYTGVGTSTFGFCFDLGSSSGGHTITLSHGAAYMDIFFRNLGCISGVNINYAELDRAGVTENCIPATEIASNYLTCSQSVKGLLATEEGDSLDEAEVSLRAVTSSCSPAPCSTMVHVTDMSGKYGFCPCATCDTFIVTPKKDDNDLNGVSTYDLVLISKHILGLEPLSSPYKIIAADVNGSNSITTFDIVELRKLILGIYPELPNNTSWRFVDSTFVFSNPSNPFSPRWDSVGVVTGSGVDTINFIAIKVGDVNGSAVARPALLPPLTLRWGNTPLKSSSGIITVPVVYTGLQPLEAIQLGIRFDPARLELISPSQGDIQALRPDNFGLTKVKTGEIRCSWLADLGLGQFAEPGQTLFHLTFKVLGSLADGNLPLYLDDIVLPNAVWNDKDQEFSLSMESPLSSATSSVTELADNSLRADCHPNPTTGEVTLSVTAPAPARGRILMLDAFGRRMFMREVTLTQGEQTFVLPEVSQLPAGVYIWKVLAEGLKTQGNLIKQ